MSLTHTILSTLSISAFGAALLASPVAQAHDGHHGKRGKGHHQGDRVERICKIVECSDDQRLALEGIAADTKEEMKPLRDKQHELRKAFKAERESENPNEQKLAELKSQMKENRADMKDVRKEAKADVATVLDDEQKAKLKAAHEARKAKRAEDGEKGEKGKKGKRGKKGKGHAKGKHKGKSPRATL